MRTFDLIDIEVCKIEEVRLARAILDSRILKVELLSSGAQR